MPTLRNYRLFISHAWAYSDEYNRMVNLLNNASNFSWSNYSVPRADPFDVNSDSRLKDALRGQINPTQVVVILGGMYGAYSKWIQFEIEHSTALGKPILGVYPHGGERMPQVVSNAATEVVNWNTSSIVDAIRRIAL